MSGVDSAGIGQGQGMGTGQGNRAGMGDGAGIGDGQGWEYKVGEWAGVGMWRGIAVTDLRVGGYRGCVPPGAKFSLMSCSFWEILIKSYPGVP